MKKNKSKKAKKMKQIFLFYDGKITKMKKDTFVKKRYI
jgi:hypothetical protein